jgi:hypothetical protein
MVASQPVSLAEVVKKAKMFSWKILPSMVKILKEEF